MRYFSKAMLVASAALCLNLSVYSQDISLKINNVTVKEAMERVKKDTGYSFVFSSKDVNTNQRVTVSVNNATIEEVIKQILRGQEGLDYEIQGKKIVLRKESKVLSTLIQEKKTVFGKVVDINGEPVIGATILEEGTTNGTVSDFNGNFSLDVAYGTQVEVSYVGFRTQKLKAVYGKNLMVTLKEDTEFLDEVVVVGFGTQKKENLTGAVAMVDDKTFISRANSSVSEILQGEMPGLNVVSTDGSLDSNPNLNIRGVGTIGSGSEGKPLILIDGMEGDINTLNPQDIKSVSVLKDAAASSIYGSRAPFGVILIKTKEGAKGRTIINYNTNLRWSSPTNLPSMMDSYSFMTFINDSQINQGKGKFFSDDAIKRAIDFQSGKITTSTIPDPKNPLVWGTYKDANANVDWYDVMYKDLVFSHEHNLSVSGGNENINYYVSGNYNNKEGYINFNDDISKRYSINAKFSAQITKWIRLTVNERFVRNEYSRPTYLNNDFFQSLARQGWPNLPVYDPNGYMFASPSPALNIRDGGDLDRSIDLNYHQIQFIVEPIKDFKIFSEFNYRTSYFQEKYSELITYNHNVNSEPYAFSKTSGLNESYYKENYLNINVYGEYLRTFLSKHNMKFMLGLQLEEENKKNVKAYKNGVMVPENPFFDTCNGTDYNGNNVSPTVNGGYLDWSTAGLFGRVNYDYDGKYIAEINLRYDGSSRFRSSDRWALFPSFSLGWNIGREEFWKKIFTKLETFKIRFSYGTLGNQITTNYYPTYPTMNIGMGTGNWIVNNLKPNISSSPKLVSSTLTWETIKNWNIGVDFGCFNNRFTGSFDYFNRFTYDMVGPAMELPAVLGTEVPKENNTDLRTYGWELSVKWQDRLDNGFGYDLSFNISDSQTKILSYPNQSGSLDKNLYRQGQMYGEIWGYRTKGIAKTQEEMDQHLLGLPNGGQNSLGTNWEAGDIMYEDVNKDGKIDSGANTESDSGDLVIIGNETPRYCFGFNIGADWKGVDIRVFFQGVMKRDYFQNGYYFWGNDKNVWWSTGFKEHLDYFRIEKDHPLGENINSYYPRPILGTDKNHQVQTRYLQNASYIRLKNIQVGYTLPDFITNKLRIDRIRIFFSGENLWTGTKLSTIFDPELLGQGYNGNAYPLSRTFSFGASVNF